MYEINEDFVGLVQLNNTRAETIYTAIKDALLRLGMQFQNCRGQGSDSAKNFQCHITGVGKYFKMSFHLPYQCTV